MDDLQRRKEEFFAGLQDLVKRTGIALVTSESLGADGEMAMDDKEGDARGHYRREDDNISWHHGPDYVDPGLAIAAEAERRTRPGRTAS